MEKHIIEILIQLKENPKNEKVDHILLLKKVYLRFREGNKVLEPIALFYLNGFDQLPSFHEKHLWNATKFNEVRKDFLNAHGELINLINSTLKSIKDNRTDLFKHKFSKTEFLKQVSSGVKKFENIHLENLDLRNENLSGLIFITCFISADFRNCDLSRTKFIKGNLKSSDFRNANLTNAVMEGLAFEATKFRGAKTTGFLFNKNYCYSNEGIGQSDFNEWIFDTD